MERKQEMTDTIRVRTEIRFEGILKDAGFRFSLTSWCWIGPDNEHGMATLNRIEDAGGRVEFA